MITDSIEYGNAFSMDARVAALTHAESTGARSCAAAALTAITN